jgi:hypothetical protein
MITHVQQILEQGQAISFNSSSLISPLSLIVLATSTTLLYSFLENLLERILIQIENLSSNINDSFDHGLIDLVSIVNGFFEEIQGPLTFVSFNTFFTEIRLLFLMIHVPSVTLISIIFFPG